MDFAELQQKYIEKMEKTARRIADLYLERFPREELYGIGLTSTEDASTLRAYRHFDRETLEMLTGCQRIADEERCTLETVLEEEGHAELIEALREHDTGLYLDTVQNVDIEHPQKFTDFTMRVMDEEGKLQAPRFVGVPLTDEEFKEILVELLMNSNHYSFNNLVYRKPEIAQKVMRHLAYAYLDFTSESMWPFVCEMEELKEIAARILTPGKDVLHLFQGEDEDMRDFCKKRHISKQKKKTS